MAVEMDVKGPWQSTELERVEIELQYREVKAVLPAGDEGDTAIALGEVAPSRPMA